ncbi:MAG: hypothetical protein ACRDOC_20080, partial [Streptosporangiaceae bacterium]
VGGNRRRNREAATVADGKQLFAELWGFYRQQLSPEGMSALDFAQLVTYLLFLEIDDERSRRPVNRVQVVPDATPRTLDVWSIPGCVDPDVLFLPWSLFRGGVIGMRA